MACRYDDPVTDTQPRRLLRIEAAAIDANRHHFAALKNFFERQT